MGTTKVMSITDAVDYLLVELRQIEKNTADQLAAASGADGRRWAHICAELNEGHVARALRLAEAIAQAAR